MFRHALIVVAAIGLLAGWGLAQDATETPKPGETAKPEARPAKDYVKTAVNDYDPGAERNGFFEIAGVDGELSKDEFEAAVKEEKGCLRKYDRWSNAVVHDLDKNGKLNWGEVRKYQEGVKATVLGRFDKDKDGKLARDEASAANAYLNRGLRYSRRGRDSQGNQGDQGNRGNRGGHSRNLYSQACGATNVHPNTYDCTHLRKYHVLGGP